MKVRSAAAGILALILFSLPACSSRAGHDEELDRVVVASPERKAVTLVQPYVGHVEAHHHIRIRSLNRGYLEAIKIKEGQRVKQGDELFQVVPVLYRQKAQAEKSQETAAQLQYDNAQQQLARNTVSENEVKMLAASLAKAKAKAERAKAELSFATVRAPFDGIVDRLFRQQGSLVQEGETLTTLSDNTVMWVYFNVPEARYLELMKDPKQLENADVELVLASGQKFDQVGKLTTIAAEFNNQAGNIPFRADFPNPEGLLRHGQTGTVLVHRVLHDRLVIPQQATMSVLGKQWVYVVDKDCVAHQREIVVENESSDDFFIVKKGLDEHDRIVVDGTRKIHDGEKVQCEDRPAD